MRACVRACGVCVRACVSCACVHVCVCVRWGWKGGVVVTECTSKSEETPTSFRNAKMESLSTLIYFHFNVDLLSLLGGHRQGSCPPSSELSAIR